jgi:hypothetical protein
MVVELLLETDAAVDPVELGTCVVNSKRPVATTTIIKVKTNAREADWMACLWRSVDRSIFLHVHKQ